MIVNILVCWFFWFILVVSVIIVFVIVLVFWRICLIIIMVILLVFVVIKFFNVNIVSFSKIMGLCFYLLDIIFIGICSVVWVRLYLFMVSFINSGE